MNLAIDIGNTAVKWAAFEGKEMLKSGVVADFSKFSDYSDYSENSGNCVLACVSGPLPVTRRPLPTLTSNTSLPIRIDYKTPQTLGADRIAAACGAWALHRGEDCLIVDAGTCITVDFLDHKGIYHGGAIMPGLAMGLQALHTFTAKLPLVDLDGVTKARVLGRSTEECILAGTLGATMLALAGYVALYREHCPQLHVLLTGGDAQRLTQAGASGWEVQPMLTLIGLNEIMQHKDE